MSYPAGCTQRDVDLSSNGDCDPIDELDELTTLDCGCTGTIRNAEESGGQLVCEEHLHHPVQLPRFGKRQCQYPGCAESSISGCENCDQRFCSDHGTRGGDRECEGVSVAYPSVCWKCGGFNADEGPELMEHVASFSSPEERAEYISALVNGLEELS